MRRETHIDSDETSTLKDVISILFEVEIVLLLVELHINTLNKSKLNFP